MAMSRKHYESVAEILWANQPHPADSCPVDCVPCTIQGQTVHNVANGLARVFSADNPRFDRARFMRACGISGEEN